MNILLTTSPAETDKHGVRSMPPLHLGYIAAGLGNLPGARTRILDSYGEDLTNKQALDRVLALSPDVVGVSSTCFCFKDGLELIRGIKAARPDVLTVMGGYHPTMFDDLMLREVPEVDLIMRGEADRSFRDLCRRLLYGEPLDTVPGLSFRSNGEIVRGTPQQIEELDSLPFPDRSAFEFDGYFEQFGRFQLPDIPPAATVVTSRSCPYHCSFCPKLFPEWSYRMRSAENVFQELVELSGQGFKAAFFQDENFSYDINRVERLCHLIIENKFPMRFVFQGTIHHLPEPVWQLMHQAGFDVLFVGIEAGSNAQLRRYRKPATYKTMVQAIGNAKKAHIVVIGFFIHGGPEETSEDCEETHQLIREVGPHVCGASELSVQPGTIYWERFVGKETPPDLESTYPRKIHEYPDQIKEEEIRRRRKAFKQALADSWRRSTRMLEVIDLFLHNRTFRHILVHMLKNFRAALQLLQGGPS